LKSLFLENNEAAISIFFNYLDSFGKNESFVTTRKILRHFQSKIQGLSD
jgi:hypothetical protein